MTLVGVSGGRKRLAVADKTVFVLMTSLPGEYFHSLREHLSKRIQDVFCDKGAV